jgi:hypothetical protein
LSGQSSYGPPSSHLRGHSTLVLDQTLQSTGTGSSARRVRVRDPASRMALPSCRLAMPPSLRPSDCVTLQLSQVSLVSRRPDKIAPAQESPLWPGTYRLFGTGRFILPASLRTYQHDQAPRTSLKFGALGGRVLLRPATSYPPSATVAEAEGCPRGSRDQVALFHGPNKRDNSCGDTSGFNPPHGSRLGWSRGAEHTERGMDLCCPVARWQLVLRLRILRPRERALVVGLAASSASTDP